MSWYGHKDVSRKNWDLIRWQYLNVFWSIHTVARIVREEVVCWKGFLHPVDNLCRHQWLTVKCGLVWTVLMNEILNGASFQIDGSTYCQKPAQLREISEDQEYQGLLLNKATKLHQKPDLLCNAAFTQQYPLAKMQKIATSNFVVFIVKECSVTLSLWLFVDSYHRLLVIWNRRCYLFFFSSNLFSLCRHFLCGKEYLLTIQILWF